MPHQCPVCQQEVTDTSSSPIICSSCGAQVALADCPYVEAVEPKQQQQETKPKEKKGGMFSFGGTKKEPESNAKNTQLIYACPVCATAADETLPRDAQFQCSSCGANISLNDCNHVESTISKFAESNEEPSEKTQESPPVQNSSLQHQATPTPPRQQNLALPRQQSVTATNPPTTTAEALLCCPVCNQQVTPTLPEPFACESCGAMIHKSDCNQQKQPSPRSSTPPINQSNPVSRSSSATSPAENMTTSSQPQNSASEENPYRAPLTQQTANKPQNRPASKKTSSNQNALDAWVWGPLNGMVTGIIGTGIGLCWLTLSFLVGNLSIIPFVVLTVGVFSLIRGIVVTNSRLQDGETFFDQIVKDLKIWAVQIVMMLVVLCLIGCLVGYVVFSVMNSGLMTGGEG